MLEKLNMQNSSKSIGSFEHLCDVLYQERIKRDEDGGQEGSIRNDPGGGKESGNQSQILKDNKILMQKVKELS